MSKHNQIQIAELLHSASLEKKSIAEQVKYAENQRNMFEESLKQNKDLFTTLDMLLICNPTMLRKFNELEKSMAKKYNRSYTPVVLTDKAIGLRKLDLLDDETINQHKDVQVRAAGGMGTTDNPGYSSAVQTTVANYVLNTTGELGNIFNEVKKEDLTTGNYKVVINTVSPLSTWKATELTDYTNLNTTIEGGTGSITLEPNEFGSLISITYKYKNILDPNFWIEQLRMLAEAHARAKDNAVLNGTGLNRNPTGMNASALTGTNGTVGASNFRLGATLLESILNASARISGLRKAGKDKQILFMNSTAESRLLNERWMATNDDLGGIVQVANGRVSRVSGIKAVINDEVITTDSNNNSVITLGIKDYYIWGYNAEDTTSTNDSIGFANSTIWAKIEGSADGKPAFTDAFAKLNSNNF